MRHAAPMGLFDRFKRSPQRQAQQAADRSRREAVRTADRKQAARQTRAASVGVVHRSEYLSSEEEQRLLAAGALSNSTLRKERDRLVVTLGRGMLNPRSTGAHRFGIYSFSLKGAPHYGGSKSGDFRPGSTVRLVREPDNEYDSNAIAVYGWTGRTRAGYVNKQNAGRLAPLLDAGRDLVAISTRGTAAGRDSNAPHILVCDRSLMVRLLAGNGPT